MNTFDSLWRLWVTSASAKEAAYRLQQRAVLVRNEFQKKEFLSAMGCVSYALIGKTIMTLKLGQPVPRRPEHQCRRYLCTASCIF
jgi:hypothetical protein